MTVFGRSGATTPRTLESFLRANCRPSLPYLTVPGADLRLAGDAKASQVLDKLGSLSGTALRLPV